MVGEVWCSHVLQRYYLVAETQEVIVVVVVV